MFKEALIVTIAFILLFFVLRFLLKKKPQVFRVVIITLLSIFTLLNIYFTVYNYLPDFVLDGTTPLGDIEGNLFLYKEDSEYSSQILFPIIEDRTVYLDVNSRFYEKFYQTYAANTQLTAVSEAEIAKLTADLSIFDHTSEFYPFRLLDYVFPGNEAYTLPESPTLYLSTHALQGETAMVSFHTENYTLYILPASQFAAITGHAPIPTGE